jgi:hypothetical protein
MPFPNQTPRAYTRANVEAIRPGQRGVYGIFNDKGWIYVGSGDIRDRLLAHLPPNGDNLCINGSNPTQWVDEVVSGGKDAELQREAELTLEFRPKCNKRVA